RQKAVLAPDLFIRPNAFWRERRELRAIVCRRPVKDRIARSPTWSSIWSPRHVGMIEDNLNSLRVSRSVFEIFVEERQDPLRVEMLPIFPILPDVKKHCIKAATKSTFQSRAV